MDREKEILQKGILTEKRERLAALKTKIQRLVRDISGALVYFDGRLGEIKNEHIHQAAHELDQALAEYRLLEDELEGR